MVADDGHYGDIRTLVPGVFWDEVPPSRLRLGRAHLASLGPFNLLMVCGRTTSFVHLHVTRSFMQAKIQHEVQEPRSQDFFFYLPSSDYDDKLYGDTAVRELSHLTGLQHNITRFSTLATEREVIVSGTFHL